MLCIFNVWCEFMNLNHNMKLGLITAIAVIALFVLSLVITQMPEGENSLRFGILTLLPPLIAIALAFITKNTVLSLFVGVFVGEFMLCVNDVNIISSAINAFLGIGQQVIKSMSDSWNVGILLQCLLIGGVIQLITKMGGAQALANFFSKYANSPRNYHLVFRTLCFL